MNAVNVRTDHHRTLTRLSELTLPDSGMVADDLSDEETETLDELRVIADGIRAGRLAVIEVNSG